MQWLWEVDLEFVRFLKERFEIWGVSHVTTSDGMDIFDAWQRRQRIALPMYHFFYYDNPKIYKLYKEWKNEQKKPR